MRPRDMITRMITVGRSRGRVMFRICCQVVAPSTTAAS